MADESKLSSVASRIAAFEARARAVQDDPEARSAPVVPSAAAAAAAAAAATSIAVRKASLAAAEAADEAEPKAPESTEGDEAKEEAKEEVKEEIKEEAPKLTEKEETPAAAAPSPRPAAKEESLATASEDHEAVARRWHSIEARLALLETGAAAHRSGAGFRAVSSFVPTGIAAPPAGNPPVAYVDPASSSTTARLSGELESLGVRPYAFVRAPAEYYDRPLEFRRSVLGASSVDQLCKTIVLTNTKRKDNDALAAMRAEDPFVNAQHYAVIVQYNARFNAEKLRAEVHARCAGKAPKKNFNMRLAPEAESVELTGFVHNAVTPVGSKTHIPLVLSDKVANLPEGFFWIGGGEADLKLGVDTKSFVEAYKPWILDCTNAPDADE